MFARKRRKRDPFIALFESLHLYCGIQTLFKPAIPRVKWTFSSFLPLFPPLHPFPSSKDFDTERLATNKSALIKALVQPSTLCACTCVCVWLSRLAAVKGWTRGMFKRGWIVGGRRRGTIIPRNETGNGADLGRTSSLEFRFLANLQLPRCFSTKIHSFVADE